MTKIITIIRFLRYTSLAFLIIILITPTAAYGWQNSKHKSNEFLGEAPLGPFDETIDVAVKKIWEGEGPHPGSILVQLFRDGEPYGEPVALNADSGWTCTWTGLTEFHTWTVDEVSVPEGYVKTISGNIDDGFVIINTKQDEEDPPVDPEGEDPPEIPIPPPEKPGQPSQTPPPSAGPGYGGAPRTADDADPAMWFIMLALSAIVFRRVVYRNQV